MVMPVNNTPLLGKNLELSKVVDDFREGQKLRQEWDARQHQKALNELMQIDDYNERLSAARGHRYAGALVPMVQQYEEERQKAALDNLKTNADIFKTFGETEKLSSESGKITAEAEKTNMQTAQSVSDYISLAALSKDPNVFGVKIGELYKRGLIGAEQTKGLLNLVFNRPQTATQTLQRMAMGNPEIAKAFAPRFETVDMGDRKLVGVFDPMAGGVDFTSYQVGVSPDEQLKANTNLAINESDNKTAVQVANLNGEYGVKREEIQQTGQNARTQAQLEYEAQQNAIKNNEVDVKEFDGLMYWVKKDGSFGKLTDENGRHITGKSTNTTKPANILKMENEYINTLQENAHTLNQISHWMKVINGDELKLGLMTNSMNDLANWTGVEALGSNPQKYREFNAFIKDMATRALRLNAGVQTDSDYKRQLEAMIGGEQLPRDKQTAIALLSKISKDFETANKSTYAQLNNVRSEYGETLPQYGGSRSVGGKGAMIADSIFK